MWFHVLTLLATRVRPETRIAGLTESSLCEYHVSWRPDIINQNASGEHCQHGSTVTVRFLPQTLSTVKRIDGTFQFECIYWPLEACPLQHSFGKELHMFLAFTVGSGPTGGVDPDYTFVRSPPADAYLAKRPAKCHWCSSNSTSHQNCLHGSLSQDMTSQAKKPFNVWHMRCWKSWMWLECDMWLVAI